MKVLFNEKIPSMHSDIALKLRPHRSLVVFVFVNEMGIVRIIQ